MQDVNKKLEEMFRFFDVLFEFQKESMDDAFKRNFLRFFFIQIDNLLKYIPYYKNELYKTDTITLSEKKSLEEKIKRLRMDYDEAYDVIRDKLGAHQQELSIENIIEWYNEIDTDTINIFYDDIKTIQSELEVLLNSNFQPITDFDKIDLSNTTLKKDSSSVKVSHSRLGVVEQNTAAMISMHSLQTKHQTILAITDSIRDNFSFTTYLDNPQTQYRLYLFDIAWLLIINDTCSLLDNLYDDINTSYANEKSLYTIWDENNINGFGDLQTYKLNRNTVLEDKLRDIRNKYSSHFDQNSLYNDLEQMFISLDLKELFDYIILQINQYNNACDKDIRTKGFIAIGEKQKLKNALKISGNAYKEY